MNKNFLKIKDSERSTLLEVSDLGKIPILFLSLDYKIICFNETAKEIYQWKDKDILNRCFLEWCKENKITSPITKKDKNVLLKKMPILDVENSIYGDKYVISWKIIPVLNNDDSTSEILLVGKDITHEKFYEIQMKRLATTSKAMIGYDIGADRMPIEYVTSVYGYLEKIISCMPCLVFWKNTNYVYVSCNDLLIKMLNLKSRDQLIGKTDYELNISLGTVNEIRAVDEEIVRSKLPSIEEEHHVELIDGRKYIYLLNKAPIFDEKGEVAGIVGIGVDITEQKKTERELIKAKEEAEEANRLKSEFIHNMEHDIRTPFAGILGMTSILDRMENDLTKKQMIKDIFFCAQELLDYSCGILDFSRIEAGVLPVLTNRFNLKELIQSIVAIEKPAAKMKGLDYVIDYHNDVPQFLIGDEYRLKRILINLLSNAIKFTSKGYIKLTIKCNGASNNNNNIPIQFIVEDSGIGIEKERLNVIYEKFCRGMPSNQGVYKGQGLGLGIVKKFVEEMDGEIEIRSVIGKGTGFTCTFLFQQSSADDIMENSEEMME